MISDSARLGAALMEHNTLRIADATFSCTVSGKSLQDMGEEAWKACKDYFGEQPFEITSLDADSIQTAALQSLGYTARVRACAR